MKKFCKKCGKAFNAIGKDKFCEVHRYYQFRSRRRKNLVQRLARRSQKFNHHNARKLNP